MTNTINGGETRIGRVDRKEAQKISQELITKALDYLKQAKDEEDPETWVSIAEAMISLGNLYEVDSKEQEDLYLEAEKILKGQIMSPMENSKKN